MVISYHNICLLHVFQAWSRSSTSLAEGLTDLSKTEIATKMVAIISVIFQHTYSLLPASPSPIGRFFFDCENNKTAERFAAPLASVFPNQTWTPEWNRYFPDPTGTKWTVVGTNPTPAQKPDPSPDPYSTPQVTPILPWPPYFHPKTLLTNLYNMLK